MEKVCTRFAPSPTGMMHIGSVRTALYAFILAKKYNGTFLLRIEDTDRTRYVEGSVEDILQNMKWLGLNFDGKPTVQSENKDNYKKYAQELIDKKYAYEKDGAIWFKFPQEGSLSHVDLIGNRTIEFDFKSQKDFVILKSDGFPTYHLAHVVDDHLMETNPVIRAEEWLSSVPKHILLFQAFGWEVPQYAHLPLILGTDRSKLSKRHGAKGVSEFREDGYLPEAVLNYMALLGWTPQGDKEVASLDDMIREFDIKDVHVAPAVFDVTKLEWMNGEYIRMMSDEDLTKRLQEFLVDHPAKDRIIHLVPLVKERIKKLSDFVPLTYYIFEKPDYGKSVFDKIRIEEARVKDVLEKIVNVFEGLEKPWQKDQFEDKLRQVAQELGVPNREFFQLIRVALSGQLVTPPMFETIQIMGEDEAIGRLKYVLNTYPSFPTDLA